MVEFYPDDETSMQIADTEVPGVYRVRESGGGYTSDYVAQKIRERAQARVAREDPDAGGGGGGGARRSGAQRSIEDPQVPVQTWDERTDVSGSPPQMETVSGLSESGVFTANNKVVQGDVNLNANGNGWAIRNIGMASAQADRPIHMQGNGIVEHCYFGEGSTGDKGCSFVHANHGGTILIRFCYFADFGGQGVYGAPPGNGSDHTAPGSGGTVIIENCYFEGNGLSNFRLGTTGSGAKNTVAHSPDASYGNRNVWAYYEDTVLENCDLGGRLVVGEDAHVKGRSAHLELRNCRWNGEGGVDTVANSTITGADAARSGTPDFSPPGRVPTSPEQAAQGQYWSQVP